MEYETKNNIKLTPNRFFKALCICIHLGIFSYIFTWSLVIVGILDILTWEIFLGLMITSLLPVLLLATTKEPGSKKKNILTALVFLLTLAVNSYAHLQIKRATPLDPIWQLLALDVVNLLSFLGYLITKMFASTKEGSEPSQKQKWKSFLYLLIFCLASAALSFIHWA